MEAAGLINGAMYVIRPDGYVALADAANNQALLRRYVSDQHRTAND